MKAFLPLLALLSAGPADHVSFIVMGKTTNHRQSKRGGLALLNYHFFAEIFVRPGSAVTDASLGFPSGERQGFDDLGYVLELHGGRYHDEAELDRLYPDGPYQFRFSTPGGNVDERVLRVRGTGEGEGHSRIPAPVSIFLHQGGHEVEPSAVDPEKDLTVTWSGFIAGRADPNGILDDLVFVVMGDCHGEKKAHSGRPFEAATHLDFRAESYTIPKEKLRPGEPHQMSVEQATVDTSREDGIVGLVTYAATSFLDFETTGRAEGAPCPAVMPRIDQGQTDRNP